MEWEISEGFVFGLQPCDAGVSMHLKFGARADQLCMTTTTPERGRRSVAAFVGDWTERIAERGFPPVDPKWVCARLLEAMPHMYDYADSRGWDFPSYH